MTGESWASSRGHGAARRCRLRKIKCGICSIVAFIAFIGILIGISTSTVSQGEYALVFSYYKQDIVGEPITLPGIKWVGPLNDLVRYPSVLQLMYFDDEHGSHKDPSEVVLSPVHSRTRDGLEVFVKVSFQWKLRPEDLTGIYRILGGAEDLQEGGKRDPKKPSFSSSLVRFARGSLTRVCSYYTASELFGNQTLVQQRMFQDLAAEFDQPSKGLKIVIAGLQLKQSDLPKDFESAIADTQKEEQDILTAFAEKETKDMQVQTAYMQAVKNQEVLMTDATAKVVQIEQDTLAFVEQYLFFQRQQADSYSRILQAVGNAGNTTSPYAALFRLMRQTAVKQHAVDELIMSY